MSTSNRPRVLLLGIGNLLWADEGFGVRVIETLNQQYCFPESVELVDGGTLGLNLLDRVRAVEILVIFDAVDYGLSPGSLRSIMGADVPKYLGAQKMSLHQTGFQEVLAIAEWLESLPPHLLLIGVQPVELQDYGGNLRPAVRAQIQPAIDAAIGYLRGFGIHPELRTTQNADPLTHPALTLAHYEV